MRQVDVWPLHQDAADTDQSQVDPLGNLGNSACLAGLEVGNQLTTSHPKLLHGLADVLPDVLQLALVAFMLLCCNVKVRTFRHGCE